MPSSALSGYVATLQCRTPHAAVRPRCRDGMRSTLCRLVMQGGRFATMSGMTGVATVMKKVIAGSACRHRAEEAAEARGGLSKGSWGPHMLRINSHWSWTEGEFCTSNRR